LPEEQLQNTEREWEFLKLKIEEIN
jgi:hypothetical protein